MNRLLVCFSLFAIPLFVLSTACTGDSNGATDGDDDDGCSESSRACEVDFNGDVTTLRCGESACIEGEGFRCTTSGLESGRTCESTSSSGNGSSSSGNGSSSSGNGSSSSGGSSSGNGSTSSSGSSSGSEACDSDSCQWLYCDCGALGSTEIRGCARDREGCATTCEQLGCN